MTIKQKNIGLIVGFCGILFIAYQFSFKKTLEVNNNLKQLTIEQNLFSNAIASCDVNWSKTAILINFNCE
mgnify:CR=1 FL=1